MTGQAKALPAENPGAMPQFVAWLFGQADRARPAIEASEIQLFGKIIARAKIEPDYAVRLDTWLAQGSTVELRDLASAFGEYFRDLDHLNAVNAIDSAHLHFNQRDKGPTK